MIPILLPAILAALLAGCSSVEKSITDAGRALKIIDEPAARAPSEAPQAFRDALKLIDEKQFEQATLALASFLRAEPTSPWTQSATYHLGRAHEALGQWSDAIEKYRRVIASTEGRAPKLQAMSLYRLSFCHEALGDDQQTLADLHDLLKRSKALPRETQAAELPARLAGAYARVGNFHKAVEFYKEAEMGIARLKQESRERIPEWLPQTLFAMGSVSSRNVSWEDFEAAIRPLARSQIYLLQAAELGQAPWADKAARDLIGTYSHLWKLIETPPEQKSSEPVIAQRSTQEIQLRRAELLVENLRELQARALMTETQQGSAASKQILEFSKEIETHVAELFSLRPAGEGPTKESRERRANLRGRTLIPDDSLERRFLQNSRTLPMKAEKTQDPNL